MHEHVLDCCLVSPVHIPVAFVLRCSTSPSSGVFPLAQPLLDTSFQSQDTGLCSPEGEHGFTFSGAAVAKVAAILDYLTVR